MTYVVSDLHGDLDKFRAMLSHIGFGKKDLMYVLGDLVDHGTQTADLITDLSMRDNVYPIAGEHDLKALRMLTEFENVLKNGGAPTASFTDELKAWMSEGGMATLEGYRGLNADMREGFLDYLSECALYEEVEAGGKIYVLTHGGIGNFDPAVPLEDYAPEDFFEPADTEQVYFSDRTLVVGHIPTAGKIEKGKNLIRINCGLRENGVLGCLCLENGAEFYV